MDFKMTRGDTVTLDMAITASGSVYSLAGASIWFTAKFSYSDPDVGAAFQKTLGSGISIVNAALGLATITISPSDTSPLPAVKVLLVYDCQVKDASGNIFTVAAGNIIVVPDVTLSS